MCQVYRFGYILLIFSSSFLSADRIDQYYQLRFGMETYLELLKKNIGDHALSTLHLNSYDNAQKGIQSTSEFVTSCISSSITFSNTVPAVAKVSAIMQLVLCTYSLIQQFYEIFHSKKEQKLWLASLDYSDVVMKFPHIILIEYQIKIMKLLIEMNQDGNPAEVAFARIHLASMALPGPYESFSKRLSKKIYKQYFDKNGYLKSLEYFDQAKIYQNFFKKISFGWKDLLLIVHKFPTEFCLFYDSAYKNYVLENEYNLKIFELIEAGRSEDKTKLDELLEKFSDPIFLQIYKFYNDQN